MMLKDITGGVGAGWDAPSALEGELVNELSSLSSDSSLATSAINFSAAVLLKLTV